MVRTWHNTILIGLLFLIVQSIGCGKDERVTEGYGKSKGSEHYNSVNGNSVITQLFRGEGFKVDKTQRITPRIENYSTVVWFRDRYEVPQENAVDRLNLWLEQDYNRLLIVVGRDHDSGIDYWNQVVENASDKDKIQAKRRLANVKSEFHRRRTAYEQDQYACRWYKLDDNDYKKGTKFRGEWANEIVPDKTDIMIGVALKPNADLFDSNVYEIEKLLEVNSKPMVTSIAKRSGESRIILVSNASFLTNFGLVNKQNRKLARRLLEYPDPNGKVLFLETNEPVIVRDEDPNHMTWAWISKPPLKYIIPHFLLLGILFCFVFFPIFGRPTRLPQDSENTTFRSHVKAMGQLMASSQPIQYARDKIEKYNHRHRKDH